MTDNTLNVSSTNTTSLYGGQGTAFPAPPGAIVINGDLEIRGCDLTSPCADFNLLNVSPTQVNFAGNASVVNIGKAGGTTTIRSGTLVGADATQNLYNTVATTLNIGGLVTTLNIGAGTGTATIGNPTVVGSSASQDLYNTTATTLNFGGAATTLNVGANTGTATIGNPTVVGTQSFQNLYNATAQILNFGGVATSLNMGAVTGIATLRNPSLVGVSTAQDLYNTVATTLNFAGAATSLNIGASTGTLTIGNPSILGTNTIQGLFDTFTGELNIARDANIVRVGGDSAVLGVGQNLQIEWNENNDRTNSPQFVSNSGNESRVLVKGPNDTSSSSGTLEVFSKEDIANGKFISFEANGEVGGLSGWPFSINTGQRTAGALSASNNIISIIDGTTRYATINPAGPTLATDLVTKAYVDAQELDTTYTINAGTNAGGADLNLVGSDASTDTILYASGTGILVAQTDASTITTSLDASIDDINDVTITAGTAGDLLTYDGADWINSKSITGSDAYTFDRSTGGTGSNAMFFLRRTRTGGNANNFQGPWLVGEYGADDLVAAPIASMNFLYQTSTGSGNVVRFTSHPGSAGTSDRIAQFKRGDFTFYKDLNTGLGTTNVQLVRMQTTGTSITGTGASQIEVANSSGSAFAPLLILKRNKTNGTAPNDGDRGDFRIQLSGTTDEYNIGKVEGVFDAGGDHELSLNVYDGTEGSGAVSSQVIKTTRKETTLTNIPTSGVGAAADVATFNRDLITFTSPVAFPAYTAAAAGAITGAVGQQLCISDSAGGGHPDGMMAFWDMTNARWSYIHDNSAV